MSDILTVVGQQIRTVRRRLDLTQTQLADLVGLSVGSVANIEAGRQEVTITRLGAFAAALRVPPQRLLAPSVDDADERVARLEAAVAALQLACGIQRGGAHVGAPDTEGQP